jgi:hypothetical protein
MKNKKEKMIKRAKKQTNKATKKATKREAPKRHIFRSERNYIKSPVKHRAGKFVTAVIAFAAVATAAVGIMMVDHNSRVMGWNDNRTELAFSSQADRLDITMMGDRYEIDTTVVSQAQDVLGRLQKGLYVLKPAPLRLVDMLYPYVKEHLGYYMKTFGK